MTTIQNLRPIKQNLRLGEKILKNFNSEYPYFISTSKLELKINNHKNNEKHLPIINKLNAKLNIAILKLLKIRMKAETINEPVEYLKKALKENKVSNCGECTAIIGSELSAKDINYNNVIMKVLKKDTFEQRANHAFTVIGMNKKAKISQPQTWGKDAIIIDAWTNTVSRAQDGIKNLKQIFQIDPKKDIYMFKSYSFYI